MEPVTVAVADPTGKVESVAILHESADVIVACVRYVPGRIGGLSGVSWPDGGGATLHYDPGDARVAFRRADIRLAAWTVVAGPSSPRVGSNLVTLARLADGRVAWRNEDAPA